MRANEYTILVMLSGNLLPLSEIVMHPLDVDMVPGGGMELGGAPRQPDGCSVTGVPAEHWLWATKQLQLDRDQVGGV